MKILPAMLMFAVGLSLTVHSHPAAASTGQTCTVIDVGFQNDSSGRNLWVSCSQSGTTHNAWVTGSPAVPSGCSTIDLDTVKMWQSMALSARLSGRTGTVWYNLCSAPSGTVRMIGAINF